MSCPRTNAVIAAPNDPSHDAHVATCSACAVARDRLAGAQRILVANRREASPSDVVRIAQGVEAKLAPRPSFAWVGALVAAAAVILIFVWPNDARVPGATVERGLVHAGVTAIGPGGALESGASLDADVGATVRLARSTMSAVSPSAWSFVPSPRARVELSSGAFDFDVSPREAGEAFVVSTPMADVVVVGTRFSVSATPRRTEVRVMAGVVEVRPREGEPSTLRAGDRIVVPEEPEQASAFERAKRRIEAATGREKEASREAGAGADALALRDAEDNRRAAVETPAPNARRSSANKVQTRNVRRGARTADARTSQRARNGEGASTGAGGTRTAPDDDIQRRAHAATDIARTPSDASSTAAENDGVVRAGSGASTSATADGAQMPETKNVSAVGPAPGSATASAPSTALDRTAPRRTDAPGHDTQTTEEPSADEAPSDDEAPAAEEPAVEEPMESVHALVRRADAARRRGAFEEAAGLYGQVAMRASGALSEEAFLRQAEVLRRLGRGSIARVTLEQAATVHPAGRFVPERRALLARLFADDGEGEAALKTLGPADNPVLRAARLELALSWSSSEPQLALRAVQPLMASRWSTNVRRRAYEIAVRAAHEARDEDAELRYRKELEKLSEAP